MFIFFSREVAFILNTVDIQKRYNSVKESKNRSQTQQKFKDKKIWIRSSLLQKNNINNLPNRHWTHSKHKSQQKEVHRQRLFYSIESNFIWDGNAAGEGRRDVGGGDAGLGSVTFSICVEFEEKVLTTDGVRGI